MIYRYKGFIYPDYLKRGNATQFIAPIARKFCVGRGLDIGGGEWPLQVGEKSSCMNVDIKNGDSAMALPKGPWDFVYSSHCLEHLDDPVGALMHWRDRLSQDGCLFLYLPHPRMEYWLPQNNRKHLHLWRPLDVVKIIADLGFNFILHSKRDMNWSFAVVGWKGSPVKIETWGETQAKAQREAAQKSEQR